jgi:hypothetical protein
VLLPAFACISCSGVLGLCLAVVGSVAAVIRSFGLVGWWVPGLFPALVVCTSYVVIVLLISS